MQTHPQLQPLHQVPLLRLLAPQQMAQQMVQVCQQQQVQLARSLLS